MNLQIGKIIFGLSLLFYCLTIRGQISAVESNPSQYAVLQVGYDSIGNDIKKQIISHGALLAAQEAIYLTQRKIRKWRARYQDYLSSTRNIGVALAGGKNLYVKAIRILDNLLLLRKAIKNNPQGIATTALLTNSYLEVAAEFISTFTILQKVVGNGGQDNMLNGTARVQAMWSISDNIDRINEKIRMLAECINNTTLVHVWDKAMAGKIGYTHGQIAERQRKEWLNRQKKKMRLYNK